MKSIDVVSKKSSRQLDGGWLDNVARSLVLKTLAQIKFGYLVLEEKGEVHFFGDETSEIKAHISVNHPLVYRYVLFRGTIGSGEAYMHNAWWSPDLVQVIRLFVSNMSTLRNMDSGWSWVYKSLGSVGHRFRINSKSGSRKNISAHYDLGNDFFSLFLDDTKLYSAAIFSDKAKTLEEASLNKLAHICKRLNLSDRDHLLEIGTGWGGMAVYAAKNTGCRVTTVTISKEQYDYARAWVKREGLENKIDVRLQDYRELSGKFDKIVSIEMVEAVGYQYYSRFFSLCSQLLNEDGLMLMQAITIQDQRYARERDRADFIQTYIFPGGCLPSNEIIAQHVSADTNMQIVGVEDITLDYAKTLSEWKQRFFASLDEVKAQGFDEVFVRMWDFYLSYCEGGFRERVISTAQFLFAKPRCRALPSV